MTHKSSLLQTFTETGNFASSLDRMKRACAYFGNPEKSFSVIHIGGTNGKGSVARMVFQVLKEAGDTVGIYTSPNLISIHERFETNRGLIDDENLERYMLQVLSYPESLNFFERCTLLAFLYFRDMHTRYVVLEVGLGGRLDPTNVVDPIITAITNIGYDHMEFL